MAGLRSLPIKSMMELHKRRRDISEPEARYFLRQIILGCEYLHKSNIVHRDLKLGNLFLNDNMEVKIGDFGLATKIEFDGQRKKTLCGTPNYIAPEVLGKKGHSYEVDIWAMGCIMYTLLVGKPPFETVSLKETYTRIKRNEYTLPHTLNAAAGKLIKCMLRGDPGTRPSVEDLLKDEFFSDGYLPIRLPTTCLTMAPRFSIVPPSRRPLSDINKDCAQGAEQLKSDKEQPAPETRQCGDGSENDITEIFNQLKSLLASKPSRRTVICEDEAEDPAAIPVLWVSKWVDYSDKYGLGYSLCDNSVGVLFNDSSRLILYPDGEQLQYIDRDLSEVYYSLSNFPQTIVKKVTLLKYFRNYMSEHLLKAGANIPMREGDELARLPYLKNWFRTRNAIVLHLNNGTLQVNFFKDHTKLILCPLMGAVTYIDEQRKFRTFRLSLLEEHGCSEELAGRLSYARTMVEKIIMGKPICGRVKTPA
uniref:serine/threonine-protein kinase PLK1 isoform X2 n=1 Tax=Myxine glutinosa TaxID=7769 RepID=UPI00358F74AD